MWKNFKIFSSADSLEAISLCLYICVCLCVPYGIVLYMFWMTEHSFFRIDRIKFHFNRIRYQFIVSCIDLAASFMFQIHFSIATTMTVYWKLIANEI